MEGIAERFEIRIAFRLDLAGAWKQVVCVCRQREAAAKATSGTVPQCLNVIGTLRSAMPLR